MISAQLLAASQRSELLLRRSLSEPSRIWGISCDLLLSLLNLLVLCRVRIAVSRLAFLGRTIASSRSTSVSRVLQQGERICLGLARASRAGLALAEAVDAEGNGRPCIGRCLIFSSSASDRSQQSMLLAGFDLCQTRWSCVGPHFGVDDFSFVR